MTDLDLSGFFTVILATAGKERARSSADDNVLRLLVALSRFSNPVKFNIGDFVTPVSGYGMEGAGRPHIVVEVNPFAKPCLGVGDMGNADFDPRPNMHVLAIQNDSIVSSWVESWRFDPWIKPPAAPIGDAKGDASTFEVSVIGIAVAGLEQDRAAAGSRPDSLAGSPAPETGEPERTEGATS